MRGKAISDNQVNMMVDWFKEKKDLKDIAKRLDLDYSSVYKKLREMGLIEAKTTENNRVDSDKIEQKLDKFYYDLSKRFSELEDAVISETDRLQMLSLESIGYKRKDERTYVNDDGDSKKIITFISTQQINYKKQDRNGKILDMQYFNAQTIEAMFSAIKDRGWNYFK